MKRYVAVLRYAPVLFVGAVAAHAQTDDTISSLTTQMTTGFGLIKTLVLAVVTFGVILGYVKLLKKK